MHVAMKDLEIRGAGNLLGGEQSGHIAGVGFDLYMRLVGEAVAEFRGEQRRPAHAEVKIELPVDAHLPHDYVPGRAAAAGGVPQDRRGRRPRRTWTRCGPSCVDRYGAPPEPVENLLEVARFRVHARAAGLTDVTVQGNHVRFAPVELPESAQLRLQRLYPGTLREARGAHDAGAAADDGPVGRPAAARRRGAALGGRADRRGAAGQHRRGERCRHRRIWRAAPWVASRA